MAVSSIISTRALDLGFILAPERYDPRRKSQKQSPFCVASFADVISEIVKPEDSENTLVLDTTHAMEGFIRVMPSNAAEPSIKSNKKRVRVGDVIISRLRPYLRQVAFVPPRIFVDREQESVVLCSTEFFVLRSRTGESIAFLVPYLLSDRQQEILSVSQEGGHHPRFNAETLLSLSIDSAVVERKREISEKVEALADQARQVEDSFAALVI